MPRVEHIRGITFTYDRWVQGDRPQEILLMQTADGNTLRVTDLDGLIDTLHMLKQTHP